MPPLFTYLRSLYGVTNLFTWNCAVGKKSAYFPIFERIYFWFRNFNYISIFVNIVLKRVSVLDRKFTLKAHFRVKSNFDKWKNHDDDDDDDDDNDEKCFLFHLKSSSHSQDFYTFVLRFLKCRKTPWLERLG